jgi:RNA polymerase sigma factor (sigma-70 family)
MARAATTASAAIQTLANRGVIVEWSDEQLLRQFLTRTDESAEAAFATLIERHGPIVHRVCLDILRDPEEARDAAQAVFLVLARKARSIRKPAALSSWLHGVALRVARRARSAAARRRVAERKKAEIMQRLQHAAADPDRLGHAELHEEIGRLPEKYRNPIILCYLQGRSQAETAEALGWPLGTVQVRLHRGRNQLRLRLRRRGVHSLSLGGIGFVAKLAATSGVPGGEWTDATARAAVQFAAGKGTAGLVTPVVAEMARSSLAAMFRESLKPVAFLALVLLAALSLTNVSTRLVTAARARIQPQVATAVPVPTRPKSDKVAATPVVESPSRFPRLAARSTPRSPRAERLDSEVPVSPGVAFVDRQRPEPPPSGRELFERVWVKDDSRSHGGDGLGPVFNGQSCVACHHLGGTGGAGGVDRNIEIATVTEQGTEGPGYFYAFSMDFGAGRFDYRMGNPSATASRTGPQVEPRILAAIHPGFREAHSVVLHHFGTDPNYSTWRASVPGQHGALVVRISERNPPPLFGAGLIDAILDEAIEAAAKRKFSGSSTIRGRVSRLKDGRIGRFGWKAQTATLQEFVRSAAAGEMGLEVPGKRQAADPRIPGVIATQLDMNEAECDALTKYVRGLPIANTLKPADDQELSQLKSGQEAFKTIGCAHCHFPKLGGVDGIYSDLLLHEMSPRLGDADAYTVFVGAPARVNVAEAPNRSAAASIQEWRTPPLWGLRDSAPYLHDGRAATIDQAIALHAGQGAASARRFAELSVRRKQHLVTFLRSLAAPVVKP